MKIQELFEREEFDEIFEKTLKRYLLLSSGEGYSVEMVSKYTLPRRNSGAQKFLCNGHINSIFVPGADRKVFTIINSEYGHNIHSKARAWFQKMYLLLSQSLCLSAFFANYRVFISPSIENAASKLIVGGNTKIRIFDFEASEVTVILKTGFSEDYFVRDVEIRKDFSGLPAPDILNINYEGFYYTERLLLGESLRRYQPHEREVAIKPALHLMHRVLGGTQRTVLLRDYLTVLQNQLNNYRRKLKHKLSDETSLKLDLAITSIKSNASKRRHNKILISLGHGDLQYGNFLMLAGNCCIVDWENAGERSYLYDLFTLVCGRRTDGSFSDDFLNFVTQGSVNKYREYTNIWCEVDWKQFDNRLVYGLVFLMEDLLFYCQECSNLAVRDAEVKMQAVLLDYQYIFQSHAVLRDSNEPVCEKTI